MVGELCFYSASYSPLPASPKRDRAGWKRYTSGGRDDFTLRQFTKDLSARDLRRGMDSMRFHPSIGSSATTAPESRRRAAATARTESPADADE